ncbi:MAG: nuclear transport factor 2 family protein [Betaproteobacteria bacterium]|nr:nuclear transport factor 2 family protein [Betaproteobacteria bacterium]
MPISLTAARRGTRRGGAASLATTRGREAVFAQFGRYGGETGGTFKATLLQVFKADDSRVVGMHRNTAERDGKRLDVGCCIVFEFKDGRVVDGREYFTTSTRGTSFGGNPAA